MCFNADDKLYASLWKPVWVLFKQRQILASEYSVETRTPGIYKAIDQAFQLRPAIEL